MITRHSSGCTAAFLKLQLGCLRYLSAPDLRAHAPQAPRGHLRSCSSLKHRQPVTLNVLRNGRYLAYSLAMLLFVADFSLLAVACQVALFAYALQSAPPSRHFWQVLPAF